MVTLILRLIFRTFHLTFPLVDVLHPAIEVPKSADKTLAHEGETIAYAMTVSNPSTDTTMHLVSVVDDVLGDLSGSFSTSLAPSAYETETFTYVFHLRRNGWIRAGPRVCLEEAWNLVPP